MRRASRARRTRKTASTRRTGARSTTSSRRTFSSKETTRPTHFMKPEGEGFYAAVWRCCFSLANDMRFLCSSVAVLLFPHETEW